MVSVSYFITLGINKYIIPKFLFEGKLFVFIYSLFAVLIFTLWFISLLVYVILVYSAYTLPNLIIPKQDDLIILIAGNYLIVILAAVIHFIKESYRRLIEKNNIEKQKALTDLKLKEAKLKLLQAQINPHFLFNMLNNLFGLVNEDVVASRKVIVKLSELLDYMLYECEKAYVPLEKEIEFIRNYIELERIRHDDNFNVKFETSKVDSEMEIAPLILFPFIENAFKHGFNNAKDSFIKIDLILENRSLKYSIQNSVTSVKKDIYLNQEGKGIGLKNIKERLELIYKGDYTLDIKSSHKSFLIELEINL